MNGKLLIRIGYWWGAIGDALLAIEMFCSAFMGTQSPFTRLGLLSPEINRNCGSKYFMYLCKTTCPIPSSLLPVCL